MRILVLVTLLPEGTAGGFDVPAENLVVIDKGFELDRQETLVGNIVQGL